MALDHKHNDHTTESRDRPHIHDTRQAQACTEPHNARGACRSHAHTTQTQRHTQATPRRRKLQTKCERTYIIYYIYILS